jgi:sorbitol-specific phosphotransferase system component IIC
MLSLVLGGRRRLGALGSETGMSTAEYAIGTIAAAAFAAVLYAVVTGGSITHALTALIQRALTAKF